MRHRTMVAQCLAIGGALNGAAGQSRVPVRSLTSPVAISAVSISSIFALREVMHGHVLVDDGRSRLLLMLDSTLTRVTIVLDSAGGAPNSYPPGPAPLIPFRGDTSLVPELDERALLVIDGNGGIVKSIAAPKASDFNALVGPGGQSGDNKGRLVYRALRMPGAVDRSGNRPPSPDSLPLVRADFTTRSVDTIARLKNWNGQRIVRTKGRDGEDLLTFLSNPMPQTDEFAVLADGSIAIVRGQDYHVDFIRPDGSRFSTGKLPYDWRRLTDDDKQRSVDSARRVREAQAAARGASAGGNAGGGAGSARGGGVGGGDPVAVPKIAYGEVPPAELPDYVPPIRLGAAKADADGNLWILPTTSAQSVAGELVYDVVNVRGELFERVRVPLGRSIAGFGKGGVVYLQSGSIADGFRVEKTRIVAK
jgi:hypothetical protein